MERKQIDLVKLGTKAKSKYELYQLLTSHCSLYLPPYKNCTVDFCADILDGTKIALSCDEVTVKKIPHIKGLRTENLVNFCVNSCNGEQYLPNNLERRPPDRDWIENICKENDGLSELINSEMQLRQFTIMEKRNLTLNIPAMIADAIESSNYISTSKGRSNLLLNRTKRFQRQEKESAARDESQNDKRAIMALENEIAHSEEELKYQKNENKDADKNRLILKKLFDDNVIDGEGNLL